MYTPRHASTDVVYYEPDPDWDALLRELATEPGLDGPLRAVTVDLPSSGSRPFGGLLDLVLVAGAVVMAVVVAALAYAVLLAS